ncbi:MAG: hypothetical protein JWM41_1749 [Gemmatimonadetes bacterium]|nr:hypothetical protein [Gemmatimonadota bacterium]
MNLEACLPADLRARSTAITKIAAGLSGAGVYRVEADGEVFVLKITAEDELLATWRRKRDIQQFAAAAGLAPRVVHVDESRRAVLSAFVADQSFMAQYGNPATHGAALTLLGRTIRRAHDLPLPLDTDRADPREHLTRVWSGPGSTIPRPSFAADAVARALAEEVPACDRALVLSHNDVNPSNLVYDGEHLLLLDWDTAGANHPWYDLAAISVFLRMDEGTCQRLLSAYEGSPVETLPPLFAYDRRLVAVLCGAAFLGVAQQFGHTGATGSETLAETLSLRDFYQQLRAGALSVGTAEGQWSFGLSLIKESFAM